jgi:ArsR family transcriptional regulator, arsenate/arsenite/antimonite-responsive transcriptional repressor
MSSRICDKMVLAMSKSDKKVNMEIFFRALADRTRLRLLNLMSGGEICVCFFVEILGTNQPKISRHLAYLRRAGIVAARREGKWIHYQFTTPADPYAAQVLAEVQAWLAQDKEMQRDRQRLLKVCCAPQLPVQLQGAPRPVNIISAE